MHALRRNRGSGERLFVMESLPEAVGAGPKALTAAHTPVGANGISNTTQITARGFLFTAKFQSAGQQACLWPIEEAAKSKPVHDDFFLYYVGLWRRGALAW
jgi:hypothetical protein